LHLPAPALSIRDARFAHARRIASKQDVEARPGLEDVQPGYLLLDPTWRTGRLSAV
jgi:hypothetical protein